MMLPVAQVQVCLFLWGMGGVVVVVDWLLVVGCLLLHCCL